MLRRLFENWSGTGGVR